MQKIKTMQKLWKSNKHQFFIALYNNVVHSGVLDSLSDVHYLSLTYLVRFKKKLNLSAPKTFNEKLQWLKLYNRKEEYTNLVDKIKVKDYVAKIIGSEYIIPTIEVWDNVEEIDFETLPSKFVLKCNHDSGSVVICKDKKTINKTEVKKKLKKGLSYDAFKWGREWPYKNVERKVFAEQLLENPVSDDLPDYKFMCYNGRVENLFIVTNRFSSSGVEVTFFDRDFNKLPFERHYPNAATQIEKPEKFEEMILLAEKLSEDIPFVRVDFYEVNSQIFFGEMTFFPGSGWEEFTPDIWDEKLGDLITLPAGKED